MDQVSPDSWVERASPEEWSSPLDARLCVMRWLRLVDASCAILINYYVDTLVIILSDTFFVVYIFYL